MKVEELERTLLEESFPAGSYSLKGDNLDGAYSLRHLGERWVVDYCERSLRCFVAEFAAEDDACEFFLNKMRVLVPNRKGVGGRA